jgi:hypothetical protein
MKYLQISKGMVMTIVDVANEAFNRRDFAQMEHSRGRKQKHDYVDLVALVLRYFQVPNQIKY